jgi:transposase
VKIIICFGGLFSVRRRVKVANKPDYRRINRYYKTSLQYRKERNRRKQILCLLETQGLSQRQIAGRLGVSERTVKRDVAKIRPYQERRFRHQLRLLNRESDEKFEAELAGKTPLEQLKILAQKMAQRNKVLKMREYYHHQSYVSIDLDKLTDGFPEVRIWPKQGEVSFKLPITLNLRFVKNKKTISIGKMTFAMNQKERLHSGFRQNSDRY